MIAKVQSVLTIRCLGYLAAAALAIVSATANARFGWTWGTSAFDKYVYSLTSVAIDLLKICLPLLAMPLWTNRHRAAAACAAVLWLACMTWSTSAAIGFAASTRGETVQQRIAETKTRTGWEAVVERAERQFANLDRFRPAEVVRAQLSGVVVPLNVWQRSKGCTEVTVEETRHACTQVVKLRRELSTAEAAEKLESTLVAGRAQLATVPVAGADADPQTTALARVSGLDEASIRAGITILLAFVLEAGSAVGFAIVAAANKANPAPSAPMHPSPQKPAATRRVHSAPSRTSDDLRRWALSRLDIDPGASVPARRAHKDYCNWARSQGIEPTTETFFGRQFTNEIASLGGHKRRTRRGTVYSGVSLAAVAGTP